MNRFFLIVNLFFIFLLTQQIYSVGQAALPTMSLAPGARATGMGEAFVAVADDAYATFYNPGALGLKPLSNSWRNHLIGKKGYSIVASKKELAFTEETSVWCGGDSGLIRYNGEKWLNYSTIYLEQNDNIEKVLTKYFNIDETPEDSIKLNNLIDTILKINQLDSIDRWDEELADFIIPYNVIIKHSIKSIKIGPTGKIWIGTNGGLYIFNGDKWVIYTTEDGFPSNNINTIELFNHAVWIGTDSGLVALSGGKVRLFAGDKILPSKNITALAKQGNSFWIGTDKGLLRKKGKTIEIYDSKNGLVDDNIKGITIDKDREVWVATEKGVARLKRRSWKKFKFETNVVSTITVDKNGYIWVGSKKGVLRYNKGKKTRVAGKTVIKGAGWRHFHAKNGIISNNVLSIAIQEDDTWILTDNGITQYDKAEMQLGLFWENLLPEFMLADLYHMYSAITIPSTEWGTIGAFVKYVNFGESEWTDEAGRELGKFRSYDAFGGICFGTNFTDNIGLGLVIKMYYSNLSGGVSVGNEQSPGAAKGIAVDFGYKHVNIANKLDVGVTLQNMGPNVIYIDQDQADPLPFTLKAGIALHVINNSLHSLNYLFDINKELVKVNSNSAPDPFYLAIATSWADDNIANELSEIVYSTGLEYWYNKMLSLRSGLMYDRAGARAEMTLGGGLKYGMFNINISFISRATFLAPLGNLFGDQYDPKDQTGVDAHIAENGSVRHKQLRIGLILVL